MITIHMLISHISSCYTVSAIVLFRKVTSLFFPDFYKLVCVFVCVRTRVYARSPDFSVLSTYSRLSLRYVNVLSLHYTRLMANVQSGRSIGNPSQRHWSSAMETQGSGDGSSAVLMRCLCPSTWEFPS